MFRKGMTILLVAHSQYRSIYVGIAERLKQEFDATIHLYTTTPQENVFYERKNATLFDSITVNTALYASASEPVIEETLVIEEARRNERELGVTINELVMCDRHLGRGFALGGFKHPRSRISEETNYTQMLNGYNRVIAFWRRELDEKQPDIILNAGKVLNVIAQSCGVPVRTMVSSRYKNFHYWAVNEFWETEADLSKRLAAKDTSTISMKGPYAGYVQYRKQYDTARSLFNTIKHSLLTIARYTYWTVRGYEKAKGYYPFENLVYLWRMRSATRLMTSAKLPGLDDLKGEKFVFFPLATEPETSLQTLSPEYFFQLSCIASLCRDLPAGYTLIVKEHHTAAGRRPTDFYHQVEEFKNARFMNMNESGFFVTKKAAAVATITGSAGFESAVMGTPVIAFGRHNLYNVMPHVYAITDEKQLKDALAEALETDREKAAASGMEFLRALEGISFDIGDFSPWKPDNVTEAEIDRAFVSLISSTSAGVKRPNAVAE